MWKGKKFCSAKGEGDSFCLGYFGEGEILSRIEGMFGRPPPKKGTIIVGDPGPGGGEGIHHNPLCDFKNPEFLCFSS